jgi:AraC family transcriptional regulator, regulatory protein of adaptative response / methylated-DNA-[protein]-cysteine methyltransferase
MNAHYNTIAKAIQYLTTHFIEQPTLKELSSYVGLSEYHLQRVFTAWVGVSPKQFLQYLTKEFAKKHLRNQSVNNASMTVGLSSSSRLYDLMIHCEAVTPGEYKSFGKGLTLYYGSGDSLFGSCFVAITERGVCQLAFFDHAWQRKAIEEILARDWRGAKLIQDNAKITPILATIFGEENHPRSINLLLKGSPFQIKVWEALLSIPEGELVSYQQIAATIDEPRAVRAAASAIARNNIAYLIPCHRVIRQTGDLGQYRWDPLRKKAMIAREISCKLLK